MGKTLGINDDYWHGLIPFAVQVILYPLAAIFWGEHVRVIIFAIIMILISLQFFNEWKQAIDPYVSLKYGSYNGFQKNSKRDTKLFIIGLLSGFFFGFVIYGILINFGGLK